MTRVMITNKFKNQRRGDTSDEVISKKRSKKSLMNYLPIDKEVRDAGELRHQLREGLLDGTEVSDSWVVGEIYRGI